MWTASFAIDKIITAHLLVTKKLKHSNCYDPRFRPAGHRWSRICASKSNLDLTWLGGFYSVTSVPREYWMKRSDDWVIIKSSVMLSRTSEQSFLCSSPIATRSTIWNVSDMHQKSDLLAICQFICVTKSLLYRMFTYLADSAVIQPTIIFQTGLYSKEYQPHMAWCHIQRQPQQFSRSLPDHLDLPGSPTQKEGVIGSSSSPYSPSPRHLHSSYSRWHHLIVVLPIHFWSSVWS